MFQRVQHFGVQTAAYADNLRSLGVDAGHITVTGSVKYDGVETDRRNPNTVAIRELLNLGKEEVIWVAGSTQAPEEAAVLEIYQRLREIEPRLRLIVVPRQKERFDDVAQLIQSSLLPLVRRSRLPQYLPEHAVILVDTIGELRNVWGLADIAFVGGSLDGQRGGQNMIEPAAYGAAVTFGPHVWNFRATVDQLLASGGAIQVEDSAHLEAVIRQLLDSSIRSRLGQAAQSFVLSQQGATERTLDIVNHYLPAFRAAA